MPRCRWRSDQRGVGALDEAFAIVARNSERFYEAELHRLQGGMVSADAAAACFAEALAVAQRQRARCFELPTATTFAQRGDAVSAAHLEGILAWFNEGFETADLTEAKIQLNEGIAPIVR